MYNLQNHAICTTTIKIKTNLGNTVAAVFLLVLFSSLFVFPTKGKLKRGRASGATFMAEKVFFPPVISHFL